MRNTTKSAHVHGEDQVRSDVKAFGNNQMCGGAHAGADIKKSVIEQKFFQYFWSF